MKHGSGTVQDAVKRPGRYGYRWVYLFCMILLLKACGEPWDGYVIRDLIRSSLPCSKSSGEEVLNGGILHRLKE